MYKILLADDETALRMLVVGTLEIGNYKIIETDNGLDALAIITREKPDLAILDVMMPGMTGYEVCRKIKNNPDLQDIKVMILTARGTRAALEDKKELLADYHLFKPFSPEELLNTVGKILGE